MSGCGMMFNVVLLVSAAVLAGLSVLACRRQRVRAAIWLFNRTYTRGGGTPPLLSGHFPFDPYPAACAFIDAEGERSLKVVIDLQDMAR